MSLKRPPRWGWVPCKRGQLGVSPFPFSPSSPQLFHSTATHRSQLPGSAVAAEPRFSLCDVFYWCWWLARPGARHHTHRLWSPRVKRVRLCEGCAGGRGVWTTVPSRRLNGSYSLERDVNVEPGCVLEYSKVGVRQFSEACPLNCSHVYEQLQPEIKLLSFFFLLRQISLPLCQSPSRKERGSITIWASVRFFKRRLKANKFLPL